MHQRVDVLVAGSGASGLVAALAAADSGARVLLVERAAELGGTSALSGGRLWIPANHLPENSGDTPAAAREYLRALFPDRYTHMTEAFIANAPAMARFVEARTPHRFAACATYPDYHPALPGATLGGRCLDMLPVDLTALTPLARLVRTPPGYLPMTHAEWEQWRYPDRFDWTLLRRRERDGIRTNGVALVASLVDGAVRAGVSVETRTRLTDVTLGSDGGVTGAIMARGGEPARVAAGAVIIATGGFDWDEQLRTTWLPGPQRATGAPPDNSGDALRIATQLGAATDNLAEGWWMPMMSVPGEELDGMPFYRSLIRERAVPRQIMVNAAGLRFVDEASPYNDVGKAMHARGAEGGYPNDPAYMIFDESFRRRYPLPGIIPGQDVPGWVARGASPRELAAGAGVDPDGLERTISRWNEACAKGHDPDFGRGANAYDRYGGDPWARPEPNLGPLTDPPYYAVRVLAGTIGTKGGPVTDANAVVRTAAGQPIPGLYAVGNAAAFWTGDAYPGPGATLGTGMTMGYLAGRHAVRKMELSRTYAWFRPASVLGALPESAHPGAEKALAEIWNAEDKDHARAAVKAFAAACGAKFPNAAAKVTGDEDELLAFCGYPAGHWAHLRTANPIEPAFATVRLRAKVTKGHGPEAAGRAMAFRLTESAQRRWRMVSAPHLAALVRAAATFTGGKLAERPGEDAPPEAA